MHRHLVATLVALALALPAAHAQTYPSRPVRIIVGYAAGSGPDVLARTLAAQLGADLGQQFFVENRTGANGTSGTQLLVRRSPTAARRCSRARRSRRRPMSTGIPATISCATSRRSRPPDRGVLTCT